MPINPAARSLHLKFVQGGYALAQGFYGGVGTYGDDDLTYGSEPGEGALAGSLYRLLPFPGYRSQQPSWIYREGDNNKLFKAVIVEKDNQSVRLPLNTVNTVTLVLTQLNLDGTGVTRLTYPLTVDDINDELSYEFPNAGAYLRKGRFLASVKVYFDSGRLMTIEADNEIHLEVIGAGQVVEGD
jgi:hypothetical protein